MVWKYQLTTNTIWASFDHGTVEADSREEAREKAITEIKYNLDKCNTALAHCDITDGFSIEMDFTQLELEEIRK